MNVPRDKVLDQPGHDRLEVPIAHVCQRCGLCCRVTTPTLTVDDVMREPRLLEHAVTIERVPDRRVRRYMRQMGHVYALVKAERGIPCVFYNDTGCSLYETRREICRQYPNGSKCARELAWR